MGEDMKNDGMVLWGAEPARNEVNPRRQGMVRNFLFGLALACMAFFQPLSRAQVAGAMDVWPRNSSVELGSTTQFGAYVPINPNTIVWLVNDIVGGNSSIGTITAAGLYTPPAQAPQNNAVTIKARSTAYPASFASTPLTITRPYPWLWSVSPSKLQVGNYSVSFNGSNFAPDSIAQANGMDLATTYFSSTKIVATGTASTTGAISFAVRQPGPGAVTGNSVAVTVTAVTITVAVSPSSASVQLGASKAFTATVSGTSNTGVTWSVTGGAANGTVSSSGVYTGPAAMPASSTVKVRATSAANSAVYAEATVTLTTPPPVTVTVAPTTSTVLLGATAAFTATVSGSANTTVNWSVLGGVANGSVSSSGVYTAPASMPASSAVTVRATSAANALAYADVAVTLKAPPIVVTVSPAAAVVQLGNSKSLTAAVTGTANIAVNWSVLGGSGNGTVTVAGVYTAPSSMPASSTVTVRATSAANGSSSADVSITLQLPPDYSALIKAARFLEQSSFGPNSTTLAQVQQMGIDAYLDQQFAMPPTPIPAPADNSMGSLQQWVLYNYTSAPDQLRQRVAYALSQIMVTSASKLVYANEILPWLNVLNQDAFGNYRDLLRDVTMCPSMAKFLDLANSMKPGSGGGANENYARELMQLFTIGLRLLNPDGSDVLDANNQPIPTYTQSTVAQVALALTGWTYATAPGATPQSANWEYFGAPLEPRPANHDLTAKSFLGCSVPAGQTVQQDLESLLDCLMNHPNIAPFVSTRLIRSLVTSNPSPGYIQRVAAVFADNGAGVRGDLKAVVRAILTDVEARTDVPSVNSGRLKEPILHISGFLRALDGYFNPGEQLTYLYGEMGQSPLGPPSVFSWFSPLFHIPQTPLFGPEFQIYSPTEATLRGNFFFYLLDTPGTDATIDLSPYQTFGNDMAGLVELANQRLLYGRMPAGMKQVLIDAATPGYDARTRIETVLYLTSLSGLYAVQY